MSRARNLADYVSTGVTAAELDQLDTTSGTPGSGNFLRGDKTWVAAGCSTSASDLDSGTLSTARMAAGSIVKVSANTSGTSRTDLNVGNNIWTPTIVTAAFTPTYSDSDVIVNCYFTVYCNNTSGDLGFATRWKRAIAGGATSYPASMTMGNDSGAYGTAYYNGFTGELHWAITHVLIDSPSTTSAVTYTLECAEYNAEAMYVGNGQNEGSWHLWFMEVKR